MDRRFFLTSAAAGAAVLSLGGYGSGSAQAASRDRLPGELSRLSNQVTSSAGRTPYDNVELDIGGDRARMFIPASVEPGSSTRVAVAWFYHSAGSSHDALNKGFKYPAELVVDEGAIAICIDAGGTQYTNDVALGAQANAWHYVSSLFNVRMNFLRATSAGGALATYVYGEQLLPKIRGLYLVNALYDLEWAYRMDRAGLSGLADAFGNDPALVAKRNPARFEAAVWRGSNVKVLVADASNPDPTVLPQPNGLALIDHIADVADTAKVGYHPLGHATPSFAHKDMVGLFGQWSGRES